MINRIAIILEHDFSLTIKKVIDFYDQFENLKLAFFVHFSLEENSEILKLKEKKEVIFCEQNNIFFKIVDFLKEEPEISGCAFQNFLLNKIEIEDNFVFYEKNKEFLNLVVGNQKFWSKIHLIMNKCCDNFDIVKNNSSVYLFSKIVSIFFENGIDVKDKIYFCNHGENIFDSKNELVLNIEKN